MLPAPSNTFNLDYQVDLIFVRHLSAEIKTELTNKDFLIIWKYATLINKYYKWLPSPQAKVLRIH